MTGKPIPASAWTHAQWQARPRASAVTAKGGNASSYSDPILDFTAKAGTALPANSVVTWDGKLNIPTAGSYWIYLQLLGAAGSLKSTASASPGQRHAWRGPRRHCPRRQRRPHAHHRRSRQHARSRRAYSRPAPRPSPSKATPPTIQSRSVSPGSPRSERNRTTKPLSPPPKPPKTAVVFAWSRGKTDFTLPGMARTTTRTSSSKKSPQSIPTPSSSSTSRSPSPCPGSARSKASSRCGGQATKAAGPRPTSSSAKPVRQAACLSPGPNSSPTTPPMTRPSRALRKRRRRQDHLQRRHQRRLPLVRQAEDRATIPLRLRPELHHFDYANLKAEPSRTAASKSSSPSRTPAP
jgi:hypothetical protein